MLPLISLSAGTALVRLGPSAALLLHCDTTRLCQGTVACLSQAQLRGHFSKDILCS